jgi:acetyltransferase
VLKLFSHTITHKTDVGGVQLDLPDEAAVLSRVRDIRGNVTSAKGAEHFQGVTVQRMIRREGYELILAAQRISQFGPVMLFGVAGNWSRSSRIAHSRCRRSTMSWRVV